MAASAAQQQWVSRVLGISAPATVSSTATNGHAGEGAGLALWRQERESAIARLRQLAAAIGASGDPEASAAIILVQAIIKNLAPRPEDEKAVDRLESWLRDDDILLDAEAPNPFGIELNLREPLLGALAMVRADFAG